MRTFLGVVYSSAALSKLMWEKGYTKGRTSAIVHTFYPCGDIDTDDSTFRLSPESLDEDETITEKNLTFRNNTFSDEYEQNISCIALPLDVLARELELLGVTFEGGYPTYEEIEEIATLHFNSN